MENTAQHIITKCGGASIVAGWLGITPQSVYRWTYPKGRGGTGGLVPSDHQRPLMVAARARGINLNPEDFFDLPHIEACASSAAGECTAQ